MPKLNVLIAGSTGYIGIQLIKLLIKHKNINIKYLCGNSSVGKNISSYDNSFRGVCLSGIKASSNSGTSRNRFDAFLDSNSRINITVMPITKLNQNIFNFDKITNQKELLELIDLYAAAFKAKSDFKSKMSNAPQFGQIIDCYLKILF